MFSTLRNTSSMVAYMQYEQFSQQSNMATTAMLDFEKNVISRKPLEIESSFLVPLADFRMWNSSSMMVYV